MMRYKENVTQKAVEKRKIQLPGEEEEKTPRLCFPPIKRNCIAVLCHQPCISVRAGVRHLKSISQQRSRYTPWRLFRKKSPLALARLDGVNISRDHLCYSTGFGYYMLFASCITVAGTVGCIALVTAAIQGKTDAPLPIGTTFEVFESPYEVYVYVPTLLLFTIVSAYVATHTPLRIYYTPAQRKYKFIFQRIIPGLRKTTECAPGSLVPVPGNRESVAMNFLGNVAYRKGGRRLVLMESKFITPDYYNVLMGFDDASVLDDDEAQTNV